jgi:hypothetical protein
MEGLVELRVSAVNEAGELVAVDCYSEGVVREGILNI